jgi:hypothetical protein
MENANYSRRRCGTWDIESPEGVTADPGKLEAI